MKPPKHPMINLADGEGLAIQFDPSTREIISVRKIAHDAEAASSGRFAIQHLALETPLIIKDPTQWQSDTQATDSNSNRAGDSSAANSLSQRSPDPDTHSMEPAKKSES